jgi:protein-tyrosine phosphatase
VTLGVGAMLEALGGRMVDVHCHVLPGLDDGARTVDEALSMARMAAADGIGVIVCTPHITPGIYDNDAKAIATAVAMLQRHVDEAGIAVRLLAGADVHVTPDLLAGLTRGILPTIAGSRYFLLEPTWHVVPPRMDAMVKGLVAAGYVPVLTHLERMNWIRRHYDLAARLRRLGAVIQITAGSVTGHFGREARYWSERLLDDGLVDVMASDGHNTTGRPPVLSPARDAAATRVGEEEATRMVAGRPAAIIADETLDQGPSIAGRPAATGRLAGTFERIFGALA